MLQKENAVSAVAARAAGPEVDEAESMGRLGHVRMEFGYRNKSRRRGRKGTRFRVSVRLSVSGVEAVRVETNHIR
jgi:hypothetical protein